MSKQLKHLAIVTTHPIQYYAPVFKLLHQRQNISIKVFYTWGEACLTKYDPGFGQEIKWDVPVLEGYPYEFVENTAADAGSHHFKGIITPNLIQQITAWQADAILVFGWAYHGHLKVLRHFKNKIPVYFRGDSTLLDEQSGIKNLMRSAFLKWVYSHVDVAFYPGTNTKRYFRKYGLAERKLVFAPHAIDNERFAKPHLEQAAQLRARFKVRETDILILFAGKFEGKKSPMLLVNAFLVLNKPDCHLLLVGNGILEPVLKQQAAGNNNIHFMGFQNQTYMPVAYQACDLFCLPSKGPNETWGLAVNEAMACSKALLLSNKVGCAVDLITPGQNGEIFKSGDEQSLKDKLAALTASKATLTTYGKTSGEAIKDWSFTKIAQAIENKLLS
ncbi:glycosyltransferase family 4 protein [Mucilaginibacter sp.]|uniref:glycosyltransferase family 4 protein n=1 Tax=Mucilaginibacter sp. TaxID=1882438 RepID=UPI0032662401